MPYESPGGAFSGAFEQQLTNDAAQKRQAMLDAVTVRKEQMAEQAMHEEMKQAKDALDEKRREADLKNQEKEGDQFDKRVGTMMRGDIPDASLVALDKKHGRGYFAPLEPGGPPVFVGTLKEREQLKTEKKVQDIMGRMGTTVPGSPEYLKAVTEYEMTTGKSLPAGAFKAPGGDTEPIARTDPKRNIVQRLVNGQWTDVTGDVPKGTHFLQEPPPKDNSAAEARTSAHRDTVYHQAVTDLDKIAKPMEDHKDAINQLGTVLNAHTREADTLIAPLVLKATVSGTGSGFRMTRPELEKVVGGTDKWSKLELALNAWSADPAKPLEITEQQRKELRDIAKAIRTKAVTGLRKIDDARHKLDDYDDPRAIQKEVSGLRSSIHDDDTDTLNITQSDADTKAKALLDKIRGKK